MSDPKPSPKDKIHSATQEGEAKSPSFFARLGGIFSAQKRPAPGKRTGKTPGASPSPKKGQSSFLKNFKVREVGEEKKPDPQVAAAPGKAPGDVPESKPQPEGWRDFIEAPEKKPSSGAALPLKPKSTIIGPDEVPQSVNPVSGSTRETKLDPPADKPLTPTMPPPAPKPTSPANEEHAGKVHPPSPGQVALSDSMRKIGMIKKSESESESESEREQEQKKEQKKEQEKEQESHETPPGLPKPAVRSSSEMSTARQVDPAKAAGPKISLPALPSQEKVGVEKPVPPSSGLPKPPVPPAPPVPKAPVPVTGTGPSVDVKQAAARALLPGQKSEGEIGSPTGSGGPSLESAFSGLKDDKSGLQLSSLQIQGSTPKLAAPKAIVKKAVVKKSASGDEPKDPSPERIKDLPSPTRKSTTTGTLKKESIRFKKTGLSSLKHKAQDAPTTGSAKAATAQKTSLEPHFSGPATPLGETEKLSLISSQAKKSEGEIHQPPAQKPEPSRQADSEPAGKSTDPVKSSSVPKGANQPRLKEPARPINQPAASPRVGGAVGREGISKAKAKAKAKPPSHKKVPRVLLPPVQENSQSPNRMLVIIPAVIFLLAGIAFLIYWMQRETSVEITVQAADRSVRSEALIVLNFSGKLEMLRNDYIRRRTPVEEEINTIKANLSAAKGDLAGREQRRKLLEDALEQYRSEIPEYLNESQKALSDLWNKKSAKLSQEYDDFKESLHKQIEERAGQLGVDYQRNPEIDAIAVAVNAFRLSLYGVAKKVNVGEQRAWAEGLLQQWNAFEKKWREQQSEIKKEALKIKKDPIPKIAETRQRIDNLEREIDALDIDLGALRNEVARYEGNLKESAERLLAIDKPFYKELRRIPEEFKTATYPINASGEILMSQLQDNPDLSEGTHFVLVRAVKGDQEFWAIQEFEVLPYQAVKIQIGPERFTDLKTILKNGLFMKPE